MAPAPIKTAKECVSIASEHSTFIEQYPLKPSFTKCECTAPTISILGMLAFWLDIFLSDKIKQVLPSLTEVSASSLMDSILSFRDKEISKVQSITFCLFRKKFFKLFKLRVCKNGCLKHIYYLLLNYQNLICCLNFQILFLNS